MDPPTELDEQQTGAWLKDKQFLHQLMDNTKVLFPLPACKLPNHDSSISYVHVCLAY